MTTQTISHNQSSDPLRHSVLIDLIGWSVVGGAVAVSSGPLAALLSVPATWLFAIALAFPVIGLASLWLLERSIGYSRKMVGWFALLNLDVGVLLWLALLTGWLPVDGARWWALAGVADLCLLFGIIQFLAWRKG